MKNDYDILKIELNAKKDSLDIVSQMNKNLEIVLKNKNEEIKLLNDNQTTFRSIVQVKEQEISTLKKQNKTLKTQKFVSYLISASALAFSGYLIITN